MVDVKLLENYISSGLNVLVTGQAGTGKTTMIQEASKNLGWKLKYFSTATLDPFADLVGIPVPNVGRQTVDYFRPKEIDDADVVFFDELNRADLMVLNAVLEIIQFRSINGEKLRNLKCVVAAINPVQDGYTTRELDTALLDRFDLYLESDPRPSWSYFKKRYGEQYARAGFELYTEYMERKMAGEEIAYFSPRRLDKMLGIFQQFPVVDTIKGVAPSQGTIDFNEWARHLGNSIGVTPTPIAEDLDDRITKVRYALRGNNGHNDYVKADIIKVYNMAKTAQSPYVPVLRRELAQAFNGFISGPDDLRFWRPVIRDFEEDDLRVMISGWPDAKKALAVQSTREQA